MDVERLNQKSNQKKKKNANQNNNKCRVGTASHTYSAILTPFGGNVVLFAFQRI